MTIAQFFRAVAVPGRQFDQDVGRCRTLPSLPQRLRLFSRTTNGTSGDTRQPPSLQEYGVCVRAGRKPPALSSTHIAGTRPLETASRRSRTRPAARHRFPLPRDSAVFRLRTKRGFSSETDSYLTPVSRSTGGYDGTAASIRDKRR